jgi:thiamine pyrophosphokinase
VPVIDLSADQDSTDLTKCITYTAELVKEHRHQHQVAGSTGISSDAAGETAGVPAQASSQQEAALASASSGAATHPYAIIALGALGGRLDHTLGNINTLHMFPHLNILLMGDGNLARLLPTGCSNIRPDRSREGPTCGLVPLTGKAVASSSGLRWNLEQLEMQFSGLVSTSNIIDEDVVMVDTDVPLLWTTELSAC